MAGSTETLHPGMGIDTRDWAKFTKALRKGAPEVAKDLRLALRAAGQVVADDAILRSGMISDKIPQSIKVRVSGVSISVVAGGGKASPLAGLFEQGNQGKKTAGDTFRHPVFGNKNVFVEQSTHPYLIPALEDNIETAQKMVEAALDATIAKITEM